MLNFMRARVAFPGVIMLVRGVLSTLSLVAIGVASVHGQSPEAGQRSTSFNVFLRSSPVGFERVDVSRLADGWRIRSTGELSPPFDLRNRQFEVEYDEQWVPRRLSMEGARLGKEFSVRTSIDGNTANNQFSDGDNDVNSTNQVAPGSIVLPDYFFGAYEAVAVRLAQTNAGDRVPIYVAPRGQTQALVRNVVAQDLQTGTLRVRARIYHITFENPDQPLDVEVWVDSDDQLLRVLFPSISLDVARQDISLVSTRLAGIVVPGDEPVRIAAARFSLAGTLTTPTTGEKPPDGWPAVVLVPGTESTDRDEYLSGVPLHGQLAEALSAAGHVVVRYDRRGVGQSGGRPESATLRNYAEDVREVVEYLGELDDVDKDRVAVVAHGEGGWIGLEAAARERRIAALVLMATPSTPGSEWVLEQQRSQLDRLDLPAAEREERAELQRRINAAVLGDGPWDDVPDDMRSRADTAWFESFLEFEPARAISRARQPVLVLHGALDRQVAPGHADRLAALAGERRRRESTVELVHLQDVNHLMVPTPGAQVEAGDPFTSGTAVGADVASALTDWLRRTLAASD